MRKREIQRLKVEENSSMIEPTRMAVLKLTPQCLLSKTNLLRFNPSEKAAEAKLEAANLMVSRIFTNQALQSNHSTTDEVKSKTGYNK